MANQRMVQTTIWRKSRKFKRCDPLERLLYLYLLTNEDTELCGAYELDLDEIALHTGIDRRMLPQIFQRLSGNRLAAYVDGWVVLFEYKAAVDNPKVRRGIESGRERLPEHIRKMVDGENIEEYDSLSKPIDSLSKDSPDLDLDSDNDNDNEGDYPAPVDSVVAVYREELSRRLPSTSWREPAEQVRALRLLARMTRETQPSTPIESPEVFSRMAVEQYERIKRESHGAYWKNAAFDPKGLELRFGDVVTSLASSFAEQMEQRDALARTEEFLNAAR